MDFLNVGASELLVLVLLALLIFGPEDIVRIVRTASRYLAQLRRVWDSVANDLRQEFALVGADALATDVQESFKEVQAVIGEVSEPFGASRQQIHGEASGHGPERPVSLELPAEGGVEEWADAP